MAALCADEWWRDRDTMRYWWDGHNEGDWCWRDRKLLQKLALVLANPVLASQNKSTYRNSLMCSYTLLLCSLFSLYNHQRDWKWRYSVIFNQLIWISASCLVKIRISFWACLNIHCFFIPLSLHYFRQFRGHLCHPKAPVLIGTLFKIWNWSSNPS